MAAEEHLNTVSGSVIGAAIEVHRHLGPGLLESVYERCLCRELTLRAVSFRRQAEIETSCKGLVLKPVGRADLIVGAVLLVELKAVESLQDIHTAQLLTYLRLSRLRFGLLINLNMPVLWRGVRRVVNGW